MHLSADPPCFYTIRSLPQVRNYKDLHDILKAEEETHPRSPYSRVIPSSREYSDIMMNKDRIRAYISCTLMMAIHDGGEKFVCSILMPTDLNWGRSHNTAGQESKWSDATQVVVLFGNEMK